MAKKKRPPVYARSAHPRDKSFYVKDKKTIRAEMVQAALDGDVVVHDGVLPVPFIGTTWQTRRAAYWWRRIGTAVVLLLGSALVGVFAVGFTTGLVADAHGIWKVVIAVGYNLTALAGIRPGLRILAEAPYSGPPAPGHLVGGLLLLLITPGTFGLVFTVFLGALRRDFIGERRAREVTAVYQERHRR